MRKGKEFEKKVQNALSKYGFIYKFRDYAMNTRGAYRIPVPSDFLFLCCGDAMFIECKEFKGNRFYLSKIRDTQIEYAKQIVETLHKYYFFIHSTDYNTLHILKYEDLKKYLGNVKSITVKELNRYPTINMDKKYGKMIYRVLLGITIYAQD